MHRPVLAACMLGLSVACLLLSFAHNFYTSAREFYVVVEAKRMLEYGVINPTQFNEMYAQPNGAYGLSPLPPATFSARDAETLLTPIPWRSSRYLPYCITLFAALLTLLSIFQVVAIYRSSPQIDRSTDDLQTEHDKPRDTSI